MKKVLLVDDDPAMNFINKLLLQRLGGVNDIKVTVNGKQALELMMKVMNDPQEQPDIILLDLNMPVMGGFAFLEAFQKLNFDNKRNIRIVILSSSDSVNDKERALEFDIKDYYGKPISEDAITRILELDIKSIQV
jgi:CheY-like chemotaxis protein